jgi:hypothetical protein
MYQMPAAPPAAPAAPPMECRMVCTPAGANAAAPQAPAAPPANAAPGAGDINDVLRKMSNSVELLTKMVGQHTKIHEVQYQRIEDLDTRVTDLAKRVEAAAPKNK